MKIAIDARFLTHPQVGGFKTYSENLVRALAEVDHENQYILYVDRPVVEPIVDEAPNFEYRVVKSAVPGLAMPIREQIALRRAIDQDQPDLVHFLCNTSTVGIDRPYVLTLHDTIQVTDAVPLQVSMSPAAYKNWAISTYSKWTILRNAQTADRVITVSNYERETIAAELGIDHDRISVTHLAPNAIFQPGSVADRARWREELGHTLGAPTRYLMGIGYEQRKNIALLIEAFAQIAPRYTDLHLLIVVANEQRQQEFRALVAEAGLNDRVIVLGSQPSDVLMKLYNLAYLFAYPSERESFGLPPLEALACGTPTLAMSSSSLPEILGNGAVLIDSDNPSDWAATIAGIIDDPNQQAELAARGLCRAAELSWQRCARDTVEVYMAVGAQ